MKTSVGEALILCMVMAAVIFFCRIFPFLYFRGKNGKTGNDGDSQDAHGGTKGRGGAFLAFVEKTAPPVAMTVLAFNALAAPVRSNPREIIPVAAAAVLTAVIHIWKRNTLLSISGGTALYMVLIRIW
jgi:branched-subunit amino acid transport protein AzlD